MTTHVLYLKGRRKPYSLLLNEGLVAKWIDDGYIEPWPERDNAEGKAYKKSEWTEGQQREEG